MTRLYSVKEIDRMRTALRTIHLGSAPEFVPISSCFYSAEAEERNNREFRASSSSWGGSLEDMLRTYIGAGVNPEELEAEAKLVAKKCSGEGGVCRDPLCYRGMQGRCRIDVINAHYADQLKTSGQA